MQQQQVIQKFQAFVANEGDTLLRLLARAEQVVAQQILAQLRNLGYENVSLAEFRVMQQLCLSGMRMTELAEQTRLSKQAIGQLIDSLQRKAFLIKLPDPDDRRAKIITYTDRGYQFIADAIDATFTIENEISNVLDQEDHRCLKRSLLTLNQLLISSSSKT
jgi:DNA-binding MarR family transcriptional regulator